MKKKFAAFILCVLCLLSAVGCGQAKTDEQTPPTDQSAVTDDYLTTISGTYVELFPELSKSEYRNIWIMPPRRWQARRTRRPPRICCWGCAWRSLRSGSCGKIRRKPGQHGL